MVKIKKFEKLFMSASSVWGVSKLFSSFITILHAGEPESNVVILSHYFNVEIE